MPEHQAGANMAAHLRTAQNSLSKRWNARFGKRRRPTLNEKFHKLVHSATSTIRQLERKLGAARR